MGASASLALETVLDVDKAKEIAGDKWTPEIEAMFNTRVSENGNVVLKDARCLVPQLFYGDAMSLDAAKEHAVHRGVTWNDELSSLFESHAVGDPKTISTSDWKALVPTLFETESDRVQRVEAEYLAILAARADGHVVVNYQMYNEQFPIAGNTLTAARIDEDYGLTDVMPGCRIRLSTIDSKSRTLYENAYDGKPAPWVREDPEGTFKDLLAGETYYCIVFEDAAQYKKDMDALQKRLGEAPKEASKGRAEEGCSCLFGNPCMDQYICRDWDNRYAVAKKNGWKGF